MKNLRDTKFKSFAKNLLIYPFPSQRRSPTLMRPGSLSMILQILYKNWEVQVSCQALDYHHYKHQYVQYHLYPHPTLTASKASQH